MSEEKWPSYRLKSREAGEPVVGSYGGHPRGVRSNRWPRCAVCSNPMCHMAQIHAGPWLDLGPFRRMSVFICHATGGRCEDWDPWKGANCVLLDDSQDENLYDGPPTVRVYRRRVLTVAQPLDEHQLMRQVHDQQLTMSDALDRLRHDKLGGGAVWLHGDQTPRSPTGQGPMRLALQMTTEVTNFDITPGGMGYVFVDPHAPDESVGRLLWQGGVT